MHPNFAVRVHGIYKPLNDIYFFNVVHIKVRTCFHFMHEYNEPFERNTIHPSEGLLRLSVVYDILFPSILVFPQVRVSCKWQVF